MRYWYLSISNVILKLILLVLFMFLLYQQNWFWVFFTGCMIFISIIPNILRFFYQIEVSYLLEFFISLSLIFHVGNGLLDGSNVIGIYNKFTHFFSATVVAFIALLCLYILNELDSFRISSKMKVLFDVIIITISFGVVWELLEWITDRVFGWRSQVDLDDTMLDLLADSLGGVFMAVIGLMLINRGVIQRISKNIIKRLYELGSS